jgi:hypothetical protein
MFASCCYVMWLTKNNMFVFSHGQRGVSIGFRPAALPGIFRRVVRSDPNYTRASILHTHRVHCSCRCCSVDVATDQIVALGKNTTAVAPRLTCHSECMRVRSLCADDWVFLTASMRWDFDVCDMTFQSIPVAGDSRNAQAYLAYLPGGYLGQPAFPAGAATYNVRGQTFNVSCQTDLLGVAPALHDCANIGRNMSNPDRCGGRSQP